VLLMLHLGNLSLKSKHKMQCSSGITALGSCVDGHRTESYPSEAFLYGLQLHMLQTGVVIIIMFFGRTCYLSGLQILC